MDFGNFAVVLWLIPVTFQIIIPLVILCGWTVLKLPSLFASSKSTVSNAEPSFAS